jgi:phage terminase large subunit
MKRVIFAPRSYQFEVQKSRRDGCKRFVEVWHRRAGKDKTWLNIIFEESQKRKGIYYHIFPSLNQGRRDIWDNIGSDGQSFIDAAFPSEFVAGKNELEMQVTFRNGSIYQIMGADDARAIARMRGSNPIGLVYSEYGNMNVAAWDTLSPVLAENGGWAAFIYTPPETLPSCCVTGDPQKNRCRGNHAQLRYELAAGDPSWHCSLRTVDDTLRDGAGESGGRVITADALVEERKEHSEAYIQREFYCKFETPVEGSYYGDLLTAAVQAGRVTYVPYNSAFPVHLAADLGARKITMAFGAFQVINASIRWLNCWSEIGRGLPEYARAIREGSEYNFGITYFPHDADHHEIGTGKTRVYTWRQLGFRQIHVTQKLDVADGIMVVKRMFPMMWFNEATTGPLRYALKHYHEKNNAPEHDDTSHFADMVRYACVGLKEPKQLAPGQRATQRYADTSRDVFARGPQGAKYATHGEGIFGRN